MTPLVIHEIGGSYPCQASGTFYGNPFYFRARFGKFDVCVSGPGEDPVCNGWLFSFEGNDPDEGAPKTPAALHMIGQAFDAFTEKYNKQIYEGQHWPVKKES